MNNDYDLFLFQIGTIFVNPNRLLVEQVKNEWYEIVNG